AGRSSASSTTHGGCSFRHAGSSQARARDGVGAACSPRRSDPPGAKVFGGRKPALGLRRSRDVGGAIRLAASGWYILARLPGEPATPWRHPVSHRALVFALLLSASF